MQLPIEQWLNEKKFSNQELKSFDEAFLCYRVKAYRAALLFSWLGFLTILKHRVLRARMPDGFRVKKNWDNMISNLRDDDKWEKEIINALLVKESTKMVFNIPASLRDQISYWRDRRNDCGHDKSNSIDYFHVEAFWSFIQSNLSRITIQGGKADLINSFLDFFDDIKTSADADITPLINRIPESVDIKELDDFWLELIEAIDGMGNFSKALSILDAVFRDLDDNIKSSAVRYLKMDSELEEDHLHSRKDVIFLSNYPEYIHLFNFTSSEIRTLWKKRILGIPTGMIILAALLRNRMIPGEDEDEAIKWSLNNHDYSKIDPHLANELSGNISFMKILKEEGHRWLDLYTHTQYEKMNAKASLILILIEYGELDKKLVELICKEQSNSYRSFTLGNLLGKLFNDKQKIQEQFCEIAKENRIDIPFHLVGLESDDSPLPF
ncbi:hypothetical protein [uncultured Sunxiuqinia sp.]|uniref:hypothetical protein n=1 Tax=uncultured Sunxiuqinia sp. TaxID=1573825 RepID=UPI002AA9207F|nr:hypothetical protein [uncultured Sunxiuqinia sp.]